MKNFLLTWQDDKGRTDYGWYDTESEMKDFIESSEITVLEAMEIFNSREIY